MLIFTLGLRGMWRRAMSLLYSHVDFTPQDKHSHTHFITTEQTFAHVNTLVETCTCHDTHLHTFPERRPPIANRDERLRQRALFLVSQSWNSFSSMPVWTHPGQVQFKRSNVCQRLPSQSINFPENWAIIATRAWHGRPNYCQCDKWAHVWLIFIDQEEIVVSYNNWDSSGLSAAIQQRKELMWPLSCLIAFQICYLCCLPIKLFYLQ